MTSNYFEILRGGINTTFQDKGRENLYHIGIPFSGAMDNRNFLLANKLVGNHLTAPVIEFAVSNELILSPCMHTESISQGICFPL